MWRQTSAPVDPGRPGSTSTALGRSWRAVGDGRGDRRDVADDGHAGLHERRAQAHALQPPPVHDEDGQRRTQVRDARPCQLDPLLRPCSVSRSALVRRRRADRFGLAGRSVCGLTGRCGRRAAGAREVLGLEMGVGAAGDGHHRRHEGLGQAAADAHAALDQILVQRPARHGQRDLRPHLAVVVVELEAAHRQPVVDAGEQLGHVAAPALGHHARQDGVEEQDVGLLDHLHVQQPLAVRPAQLADEHRARPALRRSPTCGARTARSPRPEGSAEPTRSPPLGSPSLVEIPPSVGIDARSAAPG